MFVCVRPKTTYEQAVTTDYSTLVVLTGAQRNIHIYVIFVPATLLVCGIPGSWITISILCAHFESSDLLFS